MENFIFCAVNAPFLKIMQRYVIVLKSFKFLHNLEHNFISNILKIWRKGIVPPSSKIKLYSHDIFIKSCLTAVLVQVKHDQLIFFMMETISQSMHLKISINIHSRNIYLFEVNNRNTKKRCEICSKLTMKSPKQR